MNDSLEECKRYNDKLENDVKNLDEKLNDLVIKEITDLKDFKKTWMLYFKVACTIYGILTFFVVVILGWEGCNLWAFHKKIIQANDELTVLTRKISDIKSAADNASQVAGDLNMAVKRASASAAIAESRCRKMEELMVQFKNASNNGPELQNAQQTSPVQKSLRITLRGHDICIRFIEGPNPYPFQNIEQSNYRGDVFIPKGYTAQVEGNVSESSFIVNYELVGRVVNNLTGNGNTWRQATKDDPLKFSND